MKVNPKLLLFVFVLLAVYQVNGVNAQTRHAYKIDLKIDFDKRSYSGVERVRWINRGEKATSVVYFHLYPKAPCRLPRDRRALH